MNLLDIRAICENKMLALGADSFWYWDIGALVFAGDETALSVSGKKYITSNRIIADNDIITIDLSPQWCNIWGDFARTLILEDGRVVNDINGIENKEWKSGLLMEEKLHNEMKMYVNADTTFEALYYHINEFISRNNYKNMDFQGNLGHSIVKEKNDRIYFEKGNQKKLSEVGMFTFEPHISIENSVFGYKKENIYYFKNGHLEEL